LVNDKKKTPSRKALVPFAVRVGVGVLCGAALGAAGETVTGSLSAGAAGAVGAVVGTLSGYQFRVGLVRATGGKDLPVALVEDAIAIWAAFWIVSRAS
jgi:uncharacterized membrane protein